MLASLESTTLFEVYIMKTFVSEATKVEIVRDVVINNMSVSAVAAKHSISTTTVRRYRAALEAQVLAEKAAADAKPTHRVGGYEIPMTKSGGRARNGRSAMIYSALGKFGIDAPTDQLYSEVNRLSVEAGLNILNKGTFSAMLSEYKANIRKASATPSATK